MKKNDYFTNNGSQQYLLQNKFTSYLKKAIRNKKIYYLSKSANLRKMEVKWQTLDLQNLDNAFLLSSPSDIDICTNRVFILEQISKLSKQEQQVILLKIYRQMTFTEIGLTLHIATNTVKTIYYRALNHLRDLLIHTEHFG